jgi:hypothetical protein
LATTLVHPEGAAVGNTHASSVIAPVRSSDAASGTVTQLLGANASAVPNRPCVVHDVAVATPVLPFPDASPMLVPVFSSKP